MNSIGIYIEAIEHIGSTAVPGLAAKPIIDIMAGAKTLTEAPLFIPPLVALGYQYVPEFESQMPERRYLRKIACKHITTHLHIVESASQFWKKHIAFRDLLIANPAIRESYATLKMELAARYGNDRVGYTDAKSDFILKTLNMYDS